MKKLIIIAGVVSMLVLGSFYVHASCKVGDIAKVEWKGSWYPATVIKVNGDQCYIHYSGYGSNWDEWVGPNRIRLTDNNAAVGGVGKQWKEGDPLSVNWKGSWWPAHVLKVNGNQLYIHYDNYDNSWDEWVGPERYR